MPLKSLFGAGAIVTAGVLAGRLIGLLREMSLANYFGTGADADVAISLLIVPDFITGALIGSAVGATLVPVYAARGEEGAARLFWQALSIAVGAFALLALIIVGGAANLGHILDGTVVKLPGETVALMIAFGSIPLTAATAIITSYLQYKGRFTVPAFANAIFNLGVILSLWLLPGGIVMLAVGILLASLARLACHAAAFYRAGGRIARPVFTPWQIDAPLLRTYCTTAATDIFNLFPQFAPFLVLAAAGGGLALFNYAFKLAYLPAMLGFSMAQLVLLPWFVRQLGSENKTAQYGVTLQAAWAVSLAVCLALTLVAKDIAELCFGYGKMTGDDIAEVSRLFRIGVWTMPGIFLGSIWRQILYAHGKPRMPLVSSLCQAVLIAPLCWIGNAAAGLSGVIAAYALVQAVPVALLPYAAFRQGLLAAPRPSAAYSAILLCVLLAWLPFAWGFSAVDASPVLRLLAAVAAGGVILAAGLAGLPPVRQWVLKRKGA